MHHFSAATSILMKQNLWNAKELQPPLVAMQMKSCEKLLYRPSAIPFDGRFLSPAKPIPGFYCGKIIAQLIIHHH